MKLRSNNVRPASVSHEETDGNDSITGESYLPKIISGELEFIGYGKQTSTFVKVPSSIPMDALLEYLIEHWKLESPNLLISVTGGADKLQSPEKLQSALEGLARAAESVSAWIITGGMHSGVMKEVGRTVHLNELYSRSRKKATLIGVPPWRCVANKDILIKDGRAPKSPAEYRQHADADENECHLDMHHGHFILVDGEDVNDFGDVIPFRAKLEAEIGMAEISSCNVNIPLVYVLIEGGLGALRFVESGLLRDIPIVVVEGSGRIADIIAYAYHHAMKGYDESGPEKGGKWVLDSNTIDWVKMELFDQFGPSTNVEECVGRILNCIESKDLIEVVSVGREFGHGPKGVEMYRALTSAVLKTKHYVVQDEMKLALAWNRIDLGKEMCRLYKKQIQMDELMLLALTLDRGDFVSLFVENGLVMEEFLTVDILVKLYKNLPTDSVLNSCFWKVLSVTSSAPKFKLRHVGRFIQEMMGAFYDPLYLKPDYRYILPGNERLTGFEEPIRELFLWAVLSNRKSLAVLFWNKIRDPMAGALTACKLLKGVAKRMKGSEEKAEYHETAKDFETLAIEILNECRPEDDRQIDHLLIRHVTSFGETTCLFLALRGKNVNFLAHPSVQGFMNRLWNGKLSESNQWYTYLMCMAMPPLIVLRKFLLFREDIVQSGPRENLRGNEEELVECECTNFDYRIPILDFHGQGKPLNPFDRIRHFFLAPAVVFRYDLLSYLAFLICMSVHLLLGYTNAGPTALEIILLVWVVSLLFEEWRQMFFIGNRRFVVSLRMYFMSIWNWVDLASNALFCLSFIIARTLTPFDAARYILCVSLLLYYFKLIRVFILTKLGPIVYMIKKMIEELIYFSLMLVVVILAYGIVRHSILHPNTPISEMLLLTVLRASYWPILGEMSLFLEDTENVNSTTNKCEFNSNGVLENCSLPQVLVPVMMALFMLLTNLIMLNVLISIFSFWYTDAQTYADQWNKFFKCEIILEYYWRPPIPPPFIIIFHVILTVRWLLSFWIPKYKLPWRFELKLWFKTDDEKLSEEKRLISKGNERGLVVLEDACAAETYRKRTVCETDESVSRINDLQMMLERFQNNTDKRFDELMKASVQYNSSVTESLTGWKIDALAKSLETTNARLDAIMKHITTRPERAEEVLDKDTDDVFEDSPRRQLDRGPLNEESRSRWPDLMQ